MMLLPEGSQHSGHRQKLRPALCPQGAYGLTGTQICKGKNTGHKSALSSANALEHRKARLCLEGWEGAGAPEDVLLIGAGSQRWKNGVCQVEMRGKGTGWREWTAWGQEGSRKGHATGRKGKCVSQPLCAKGTSHFLTSLYSAFPVLTPEGSPSLDSCHK